MKKQNKDIDNENAEYNTANKSTALSKVRRIIYLFSGLFFIGVGCSIIYSVGSEALVVALFSLILGFFSIKEVFFPYDKKKKGGLLGKPGTFSRKANVGCLVILIPSICLFVWVGYTNWKTMQLRAIRALAEDNLRKVFTSCEKYWKNNPTNDCSLPKSKKEQLDWGLNPDMVEILIINGQKGSFEATAKHYESDTIFQIDNNGNIDFNRTK